VSKKLKAFQTVQGDWVTPLVDWVDVRVGDSRENLSQRFPCGECLVHPTFGKPAHFVSSKGRLAANLRRAKFADGSVLQFHGKQLRSFDGQACLQYVLGCMPLASLGRIDWSVQLSGDISRLVDYWLLRLASFGFTAPGTSAHTIHSVMNSSHIRHKSIHMGRGAGKTLLRAIVYQAFGPDGEVYLRVEVCERVPRRLLLPVLQENMHPLTRALFGVPSSGSDDVPQSSSEPQSRLQSFRRGLSYLAASVGPFDEGAGLIEHLIAATGYEAACHTFRQRFGRDAELQDDGSFFTNSSYMQKKLPAAVHATLPMLSLVTSEEVTRSLNDE